MSREPMTHERWFQLYTRACSEVRHFGTASRMAEELQKTGEWAEYYRRFQVMESNPGYARRN